MCLVFSCDTLLFIWTSLETKPCCLLCCSSFTHGTRFGVYVPLCCFHQEGGKSQPSSTDCSYPADQQQTELTESSLFRPRDFLFLLRENLREQFSSPPHMPSHTCPPHTHSETPEMIRAEVEELKSDFNRRIKEVLFNSLFSAYYVAFLPLCFVKVCICLQIHLSTSDLLNFRVDSFLNDYFHRAPSTMTCAGHVSI